MGVVFAVCCLMLFFWFISLIRRDAGVIDIAWGLGFILIAWVNWFATTHLRGPGTSELVLPILTSLWGVRLSLHLFIRNHCKPEDYRYRQMREKHGESFWWVSLVTVFGLQAAIMLFVSLPLQFAFQTAEGSSAIRYNSLRSILNSVGIILWLIGWLFETIGDWQLTQFRSRKENQGQVMQAGLWRYTRHPNYFGDCVVWWSFYLIAVANGAPWWTVLSPILMTFLLMRVSGVTLLEKSLVKNKAGYEDYIRRTNAFFPWPPARQ